MSETDILWAIWFTIGIVLLFMKLQFFDTPDQRREKRRRGELDLIDPCKKNKKTMTYVETSQFSSRYHKEVGGRIFFVGFSASFFLAGVLSTPFLFVAPRFFSSRVF